MIDLEKWNRLKQSSSDEIKTLMAEIEVLCLDIVIEKSKRAVEHKVKDLTQKIKKLPKEVRLPQGTNTAALLFAEVVAGRLAQRMLKKGSKS